MLFLFRLLLDAGFRVGNRDAWAVRPQNKVTTAAPCPRVAVVAHQPRVVVVDPHSLV